MAKGTKTGGRQKGTPNKVGSELKLIISELLEKELQNLPTLLDALEPKDKAQLLVKLLPYCIAKQTHFEEREETLEEEMNRIADIFPDELEEQKEA